MAAIDDQLMEKVDTIIRQNEELLQAARKVLRDTPPMEEIMKTARELQAAVRQQVAKRPALAKVEEAVDCRSPSESKPALTRLLGQKNLI